MVTTPMPVRGRWQRRGLDAEVGLRELGSYAKQVDSPSLSNTILANTCPKQISKYLKNIQIF